MGRSLNQPTRIPLRRCAFGAPARHGRRSFWWAPFGMSSASPADVVFKARGDAAVGVRVDAVTIRLLDATTQVQTVP